MTFKPAITLSRCLTDPSIFGRTFAGPSFWTWRVVAKLLDGIELAEQRERDLYRECTGLEYDFETRGKVRRLINLTGRRGGKDRFMSAVAVWRAALCVDWREFQSAGEGAVVILLGADKKQAAILRQYCRGLLEIPLLAAEVVRPTAEVTEFRNGASLEVSTNDQRLVRGRSTIAVLGSETCHWKVDEYSASSDEEVVNAAEPSMAMAPDGGILALASSVYRRRGYMYKRFKELHGNPECPADTIVWFAPSATMNPKLPQHVVDRALAEDAPKARAEFLNIWRTDIDDVFPAEVIDKATDRGTHERAPVPGIKYRAFVDCAGGTGQDSFAFAIAHRESSYVLDVVREYKPRFVPAQVITELAQLCKVYGITQVCGDKYAVGFHSAEWSTHGITFKECERSTSENYLALLPMMLAGRVRLIDSMALRSQLESLERRVGANDRESVSHPQHASAHDDVACAVAGALVLMAPGASTYNLAALADPHYGECNDEMSRAERERTAWRVQQFIGSVYRGMR